MRRVNRRKGFAEVPAKAGILARPQFFERQGDVLVNDGGIFSRFDLSGVFPAEHVSTLLLFESVPTAQLVMG